MILYIVHVNYLKNFNINNYIAIAVHLLNNKQVSLCFILYDFLTCDASNAQIKANHEYHYFRLYINLGHVLILSLLTCQCSLQGKNPLIYIRRFKENFLSYL